MPTPKASLKEKSRAQLTWGTERQSSHRQAGTMVRTGLRDMPVRARPRLVGRASLSPTSP